MLLPAWAARRRDGAEVLGDRLLDNANGFRHRRIAVRLGRPPGTVRGWLHTFARRAELISAHARRWTRAIDDHAVDQFRPGRLGGRRRRTLLGTMARACRLQL